MGQQPLSLMVRVVSDQGWKGSRQKRLYTPSWRHWCKGGNSSHAEADRLRIARSNRCEITPIWSGYPTLAPQQPGSLLTNLLWPRLWHMITLRICAPLISVRWGYRRYRSCIAWLIDASGTVGTVINAVSICPDQILKLIYPPTIKEIVRMNSGEWHTDRNLSNVLVLQ